MVSFGGRLELLPSSDYGLPRPDEAGYKELRPLHVCALGTRPVHTRLLTDGCAAIQGWVREAVSHLM